LEAFLFRVPLIRIRLSVSASVDSVPASVMATSVESAAVSSVFLSPHATIDAAIASAVSIKIALFFKLNTSQRNYFVLFCTVSVIIPLFKTFLPSYFHVLRKP
jgi:hypothetical protein